MKKISTALMLFFTTNVFAVEKINIMKWTRMSANKFGCYLEKSFNHKDKKFNCSLVKYKNKGDPCKNVKAYYEGPSFPSSSVQKIHPKAESVTLSWEHGVLQGVTIYFKNGITESEIERYFKITDDVNYPANYKNIMSIDTTSGVLSIQGFDHIGAADVECN
jgi:hypothetical protein